MAVITLSRSAELRQEAVMRTGLLVYPADKSEFTGSDWLLKDALMYSHLLRKDFFFNWLLNNFGRSLQCHCFCNSHR